MKTLLSTTLLLLCCAAALPARAQLVPIGTTAPTVPVSSVAALAAIPPSPDGYSATEIGPNHRRWTRLTALPDALGNLVYATNSYLELQDCLYYVRQGPTGPEWAESKAEIEAFPGGAIARQGPIQMIFPNDLSAEPIDAQTAAGRFRSTVACLSYADYTLQTNLIIAEIQPCQGQIIAPNQVLYPKALSDNVNGSVRYTYRKGGWEQDILIDDPGSLPTPESMGLDSGSPTLVLQVTTEFLEAPPPQTSQRTLTTDGLAVEDQEVDWATLRLGQGQAFFFGPSGSGKSVTTAKRWQVTPDNRKFLVEQVPFAQLLREILSRSGGASLDKPESKIRALASLDRLPKLKPAKPNTRPMELAAARPPERGVVIDYVTMPATTTNYVFQGDTTYYISGSVTLAGTNTWEGGTVLKFATNAGVSLGPKYNINPQIVFLTKPYLPVVFTAKDDNTVGESIGTGNPSGYYSNPALSLYGFSGTQFAAHLRVAYAQQGLSLAGVTLNLSDAQFVNCQNGVQLNGAGLTLRNALFANTRTNFNSSGGASIDAQNVTFSGSARLASSTSPYPDGSLTVTNGLFVNVTNLNTPNLLLSGSYNGFFNTTQFGSSTSTNSFYPFQTAGAGSFYLTNGCLFRNAGTTNINSNLLTDLRTTTTYPPIVYSNVVLSGDTNFAPQAQRDTDTPDLGYHYDPLDYAISGLTATNILLLNNGVALGTYGTSAAITVSGAGQLLSQGLANNLNHIVRYNTVQEQSSTNWSSTTVGDAVTFGSTTASAQCTFTAWSILGGAGNHMHQIYDATPSWFAHNQFAGGAFTINPGLVALTNCLWERVLQTLNDQTHNNSWYLYNNLFRGGSISYRIRGATPVAIAYDNLFDSTSVTNLGTANFTSGYNGYVTNYTRFSGSQGNDRVLSRSPVYQTSYLGNYYYPTNDGMLSTLIDAGSRLATDAGLFYFTTTTNQMPEGGTMVDIGFHYVAVDPNTGQPYDWDRDGLPDYLYGSGSLLDAWLIQYFGRSDMDPYGLCPSGDGWTLLQAYQNGWNPTNFYTPPAPQGLAVRYVVATDTAIVGWGPPAGGVSGYLLQRYDPAAGTTNNFPLSANVNQFTDSTINQTAFSHWYGPILYRLQAQYGGNNSAWTPWTALYSNDSSGSAFLLRGPQGRPYLVVGGLPQWAATVNVVWVDVGSLTSTNWTLSPSVFTNGTYAVPDYWIPAAPTSGSWYLDVLDSNGILRDSMFVFYHAFSPYWGPVFFDGRAQLKQNLTFLLRAANVNVPFQFVFDDSSLSDPFYGCPANYAYASFYRFTEYPGYTEADLEEFRPFDDNYLLRNFAFTTADTNGLGSLNTGAGWDGFDNYYTLQYPPKYLFQPPSVVTNINPVLSPTGLPWTYFRPYHTTDTNELGLIGITLTGTNYSMASSSRNLFGLQFQSAVLANGVQTTTLNAGATIPDNGGVLYPATAQPILRTAGYYFAATDSANAIDPCPGMSTFAPTNTSPLLVTSLGSPFRVAGYAKQAITNGYSAQYAYLGQYFTNAFTMDGNGNVTTNSAGLFSPYGEFFPMQPGPAALVTMPDLDTGQRGTGVVNVIKLQTDVDHNNQMDLSFGGPDNTSQARPMVAWVNNDHDEPGSGGSLDNDLNAWGNPPANRPDYTYGAIRCRRNLEDFFRLWACGLPKLPPSQGYTVTFTMSPSSGTPAINLYAAITNSADYLTDTNVAAAQFTQIYFNGQLMFDYSKKLGTISASQSYTLPLLSDGTPQYTNFLFEGAGIGVGQLTMTISQTTAQGSNVLAQTSAWLDLRDVDDMFERVQITGVTNIPPASGFLTSGYNEDNFVSASSDEDTNIVVFAHGWRMGLWDYYNFSESMFKRLYWQGFRGRFVAARWSTLSADDFSGPSLGRDYMTYNSSEFRAWESAAGLSAYFTYLKQRFPNYSINVCAHSMGNVVMAEALKLQLAAGQQNIRNYVLMQAAVPASCYDTSFTNYAPFIQAEQQTPTPDIYRGYPGSIGGAVSGSLVDFYNVNDYALATGTLPWYGLWLAVSWEANQENFKPDTGLSYYTDGTNCWYYDGVHSQRVYLTDSHEKMSFCARPRSKAVGAQAGVGGAIQGGSVDLTANFGFFQDSSEHSAQFNWPIQRLSGFYRRLGTSLGVLPTPAP